MNSGIDNHRLLAGASRGVENGASREQSTIAGKREIVVKFFLKA